MYIMGLTRTQISLSDDDRQILDAVSRRTGQSMSALIREAIHSTYGEIGQQERVLALIDDSFGVMGGSVAGERLVDGIRSGRRLADLSS